MTIQIHAKDKIGDVENVTCNYDTHPLDAEAVQRKKVGTLKLCDVRTKKFKIKGILAIIEYGLPFFIAGF